MNEFHPKFADTSETLFAIKNLADAQFKVAESMITDGSDSDNAYSIRTLSEIICQNAESLVGEEMDSQVASALFTIKNLAYAQIKVGESIIAGCHDSDTAYSIRALSKIISLAADQSACKVLDRQIKSIVEE
jgi:hypothetical protein